MKKNLIKGFIIVLMMLLFFALKKETILVNTYNYDVTIYRDIWGVPHIYGEKDTDAAFGLAFAHAEDDFTTIQDVLTVVRGKLASVKGKDSAPVDYLIGLLKVWDIVDSKYESDLSGEVRAVCEAYADGINRYIELNPSEAISGLHPVKGKDIVAGFVFRTPLMFDFDWYIKELMKDKKPVFSDFSDKNLEYSMYGSNVFAIAPSRSEDNHTRIAINSHQPWEGPVTWYEAHVHSNEGWNMSGGLFPGSPVILKGYNDNLAWSHTVNGPDLVDIYELNINPENNNQYLMDGKWLELEKKVLPIKVKLWGPISWTFKRDLFWSIHGPVIKTNHGIYALRYSGDGLLGQVEQWFRMNKSSNLGEFKDAMRLMQIPMFNTMYADKLGNIFYVYNGLIPKRNEKYNYSDIVAGDKESLIWNSYYNFDELPQVTNPASGYLQNCNSTPYLATVGEGNPEKVLPDNTGIESFQTNRAYRANELYGKDLSITKKEFYEYKYDTYYSENSVLKYALDRFLSEIKTDDTNLLKGIKLLREWDLGNQKDNTAAALAMLTFKITYDINDFKYDYDNILEQFKKSITFLKEEFGRIDVPLGQLQIIKRGDAELPLDGGPDLLRAVYSKMINNRKVATHGDCFFQMVEWDQNGELSAESIHQYGSATQDILSDHYSDQSYLFSDKQMKPSWIELDSIKKHLKSSYTP
ncbi:acylase [bacterium]|nr:acylase [bacterium]